MAGEGSWQMELCGSDAVAGGSMLWVVRELEDIAIETVLTGAQNNMKVLLPPKN